MKQLVPDPADGSFLGTYVFKNGASEVMKIKLSTPAVKRLTLRPKLKKGMSGSLSQNF